MSYKFVPYVSVLTGFPAGMIAPGMQLLDHVPRGTSKAQSCDVGAIPSATSLHGVEKIMLGIL